jgi:hypothetical protein
MSRCKAERVALSWIFTEPECAFGVKICANMFVIEGRY